MDKYFIETHVYVGVQDFFFHTVNSYTSDSRVIYRRL